jgi:hypothetical protein
MSESLGGLSDLATYLGAGVLIFLVLDALYNFVNGVRIHFLNTGVDLKEKYGDWAGKLIPTITNFVNLYKIEGPFEIEREMNREVEGGR